ncbi:MAG: hypothetical protein PHI74_07815, partial [Methanocellales archaeon]|nr:hypothetical protein [Methanocellales archaeon]MDD5485915.1 hypothetical protein [Methanocellales archaeon]
MKKRYIYMVCTIALLCAILVMSTASAADEIVWEYTGAAAPLSAERLPNGNTLIADTGNFKVIEVTPDGTIVWEYLCTGALGPSDADRLPNGNTLITMFGDEFWIGHVTEVTPGGVIVWEYSGDVNYLDADRLPDGNTLIADFQDRAFEVDPDGIIVWEYANPYESCTVEVDRLSNGNTLIATWVGVMEVTPAGTIVWQYPDAGSFGGDADRLPDGNTLISDANNNRVIEVDPAGTIVWEYITGGEPTTVERLSNGNTLICDPVLNLVFEVSTVVPDWNLTLTGEVTDTINRTSFEEGAACHNASWNDGTNTWAGIPLWRLVGWVDDL